jgi:hypothetical protein
MLGLSSAMPSCSQSRASSLAFTHGLWGGGGGCGRPKGLFANGYNTCEWKTLRGCPLIYSPKGSIRKWLQYMQMERIRPIAYRDKDSLSIRNSHFGH